MIEGSRRVLRRRMFPAWPATTPAADRRSPPRRARSREVRSLLFHWAFLLMRDRRDARQRAPASPAGRSWWKGKTWTDARANYDGQLRTGRFSQRRLHGRPVCA